VLRIDDCCVSAMLGSLRKKNLGKIVIGVDAINYWRAPMRIFGKAIEPQ
jgi:hypothetical protein